MGNFLLENVSDELAKFAEPFLQALRDPETSPQYFEGTFKRLWRYIEGRQVGIGKTLKAIDVSQRDYASIRDYWKKLEEQIERLPRTHVTYHGMIREETAAYVVMKMAEHQLVDTKFMQGLSCELADLDKLVKYMHERLDERIGVQQGANYFHKKDQPYYSGPQNPPQRPSATDFLPGHSENPEISACYCIYCHKYVRVPIDLSSGKPNCESHAHLCHDNQYRMLTTVSRMANDPRASTDDLADRPKHPHSGTQT